MNETAPLPRRLRPPLIEARKHRRGIKAIPALLLIFVALAGCAVEEHGGQVTDVDVLTADESLLQSIEEDYGVADENGRIVSFSDPDAVMAWSLTSRGARWTVEDVRRDRPEARRIDKGLTLEWTREYLARLEGPGVPPASKYIFGTTLAEEVAGAKNQIGYITNSYERKRQYQLSAAEQLEEARKYLRKLKGSSPPSYPYLWGGAGDTLEGEIARVETKIESLRNQVNGGEVR